MVRLLASKVSVYEIEVDLERLDGKTSNAFPRFIQGLMEALPSLYKHKCVFGREGGFVQELREGTNFAHILEHILLELQHLADAEGLVYSGWTRPKRDTNGDPVPGQYAIHYETRDPITGHLAALLAMELVNDLIRNRPVDVGAILDELRNPCPLQRGDSADCILAAGGEVWGTCGA